MTSDEWRRIEGPIPYSEMVRLQGSGKLRLGIDNGLAMCIIRDNKWPLTEKAAICLWDWVSFLTLIGGIVLSFTWHWWSFIVGFIVMRLIWKANRKSAAGFILEKALQNQELYDAIMLNGGWMYMVNGSQNLSSALN